ncbi:MAG: hypothetical protein AAF514_11380 [Verrucomicrobiota bacterium]
MEKPGLPITQFDRDWAAQVFAGALRVIADEYYASDRGNLFEHLKPYVLAHEAKMTSRYSPTNWALRPGALRPALSRLRERFRKQLRAGVPEEMRYLCEALMSQPSEDENAIHR